jgi:integrase
MEVLSKLFLFAQEYEVVKYGHNPCRFVKAFPEAKRHRYATISELGAIGMALNEEFKRHPREVLFIRLLALTGARPVSLMRVTIGQFYRVGCFASITFHGKSTARTGQLETVVIPVEALSLFDGLRGGKDDLLIGKVDYARVWDRVRRAAGCPDLWVRDFRRTFATIGLSTGVELGVVGELLNHKSAQTTKTYAKLLPGRRQEAANSIAKKVSGYLSNATEI